MKIIIEIELGNEEMQTGFDAVYALNGNGDPDFDTRGPLTMLAGEEFPKPGRIASVFDINGNVVGKIEVLP